MPTTSSTSSRPLQRAIFLDRDGTLNEERNYLSNPDDFVFIPGSPQAIRRLRDAGFLAVVVTNQSGVARGYFSLKAVETLHRHVQHELAGEGTAIDAFYVCPHHPQGTLSAYRHVCSCRKPQPGLLLQAARDLHIDLSRSYMVGDKCADLAAGQAAGCTSLLVLSGYGQEEQRLLADNVPRFTDLAAAVDAILRGD